MGKEEFGEHSRKKENSDGEERPFKKARYVWQLKGKYHLKKHYRPDKNKSDSNEGSSKSRCIQDRTLDSQNLNNNNNESENNNNTCLNRCCIDSILAKSSAIMESDDPEQVSSSNNDRSLLDETPVSLVQLPKNKDNLLYKWQARQVAKSFVDNTINSILEHCKLAPFDATDIIENCENGEQVEDEGILMAIQSHGLQSNVNGLFANSSQYQRDGTPTSTSEANMPPSSTEKLKHIEESALDNLENAQNEIVKNSSSRRAEVMACDSSGDDLPCDKEKHSEIAMDDPMDFLNAAVSVAIQKKGLTSYNYG